MTRLSIICFALPFALLTGTPAGAQDSASPMGSSRSTPDCRMAAPLPQGMESWSSPVPLASATGRRDSGKAVVTPGHAVTMALHPTSQVAYAVPPAKPGDTASYGGMARFTVTQAGTWRVALGSGAWVDVVKGRTALPSVAHGHGPACSGIRKMVDFRLEPGAYMVQIAASGDPALTVLVTRLP